MRYILFLALGLAFTASAENSASQDQYKVTGQFNADNSLHTGIKSDTSMDFSTGMAGANFSMYGIARGNGNPGNWGVHDIVGVHGTAVKNGAFWAAGIHCDVYDTVPGGTSVCLNVEFPQTQRGTNTIGINMQPHTGARDLVGMQIQSPEAFKYSLYIPNSSIAFGQVDTVPFGMRFNTSRQSLEFFRAIGKPDETKVGEIKMDFGQAK
jgi:hypothetical protein